MAVQACKLNVKEKCATILYQNGGDMHVVLPMIMLRELQKFSDSFELRSKARKDSIWQNELVLDEQQEERGKKELRDQEAVPQVCKRKLQI